MEARGELQSGSGNGQALHWPGRVVSAEDLRRSLNGHRELVLTPHAVLTPLAIEELRTRGVQVTRQTAEKQANLSASWGYAQERPEPAVASAVKSLERDGVCLKALDVPTDSSACRWALAVAQCVARGDCKGGVVFCQDPGLLCCVANKLTGLRAAWVMSASQAARATRSLGANLIAVEVAGRTFFEIRQILRTLCAGGEPACPVGVACTLQELDSHAHR